MPVARLSELAANPEAASRARTAALVTELVASKRTRATKIARYDAAINGVFSRFQDPKETFTQAKLAKLVGALRSMQGLLTQQRQATLRDLHTTVQAGIKNRGLVAQYEDQKMLSAKLAALLVTAKASLAADNTELGEHDIRSIDSDGYVEDEPPATEDNLSLAADDDLPEPVQPPSPAVAAEGGNPSCTDEHHPDQPLTRNSDPNPATAARTAAPLDTNEHAGDSNSAPQNPRTVNDTVIAAPLDTNEHAGDSNNAPQNPQVVNDTVISEDTTLTDAIDQELQDPDDAPAPNNAYAADAPNPDDPTVPHTDDSFVAELDLPDSGIDEAVQSEILGGEGDLLDEQDQATQDGNDNPATDDDVVSAAVATRRAKHASARRTPGAGAEQDDSEALSSIVTEMLL